MSETIQLQVDAETARAFQVATVEEQQKLGVLLSVWLKQCGPTIARGKNIIAPEENTLTHEQEFER